MIKQYFADGLISIAIILSLLRTDINQYLNNSLINYPEIHDIILGTSTAYTQANFHNNLINNVGGYSIHPKNVESEYWTSNILEELRSLSRFRRFHGLDTDINAFLVNPPTSFLPHGSSAELQAQAIDPPESTATSTTSLGESLPSSSSTENTNQNDTTFATNENLSSGDTASSTTSFALHPMHNVLSDPFVNSLLTAANLTNEDLDLIETLWQQDIDLGIGKEVFDLNLRRELEREKEIELQKQREKQKELELLQCKLEEERRQHAQNWIAQNYIQDGETGEWIAINNTTPANNNNSTQQTQDLSFEEALRILDGTSTLSNETIAELEDYINNSTTPVDGGYLQNVSPTQTQIDQLIETAENFNQTEVPQTTPSGIQTQASIEQHWQDLVSVLNLTGPEVPVSEPMDIADPSSEDVLLQNVTMPQTAMNSTTLQPFENTPLQPFENTPLQPFENTTMQPFENTTMQPFENTTMQSFENTTGYLAAGDMFTNTTGCQEGVNSSEIWNTSDMFPNMTSINQSDAIDVVSDILPDLLAASELDNITLNVEDMDLTDSLQCLQMVDEVSSDSAVSSMGSMGSPSQDFNETSTLGSMSPFDGVEGATGGSEFAASGNLKLGKYDPDDYNYSYSPYDTGDFNEQSNYSSSNESHSGASADASQVQHNHTYPLQPGAQPKDTASKINTGKTRPKGPHSRDEKRAREMKLPLSVSSIIQAPVDDFNDLLSKYKLTEPQLQLVRDIRRRGKNKVAAQNCRKRKLDSIVTLEDELNNLKDAKDKLLRERYMIDKETREMKGKFRHLYQEVFQSLRDEHGQPYDPNEFSLQETSDGNVFLVPRNGTTENRMGFNRKRKDKK